MKPSKFNSDILTLTAQFLAVQRPFPSFQRLASLLGVSRATIYNWRATQPDFDRLCQHILLRQLLWCRKLSNDEFELAVLHLYQDELSN